MNRIAIDVGNSRISSGVFVDGELVDLCHYLVSKPDEASDALLAKADAMKAEIALCSVVPSASKILVELMHCHKKEVFLVTQETQTIISKTYQSMGGDRIANIAAAMKLYSKNAPTIVLDMGTATTLTAVSPSGEFLGGLITLGLETTFRSLHQSTAQLPNLSSLTGETQLSPLAFDTASAIASGCIFAHVGIIENWVKQAKLKLGNSATVVATGGCATVLSPYLESVDHFDQDLTLKGINFIAEAATVQADRA